MAGRCCCLIDWCSARTFGSILTYLWFVPGTPYSAEVVIHRRVLIFGSCLRALGEARYSDGSWDGVPMIHALRTYD